MTEEEAKTKKCPRKMGHDISYGNQDHLCEASACMAWRGSQSTPVTNIEFSCVENWQRAGWVVTLSEPDINGTYAATRPQDGFCGLAGRPE